MMWGYWDLAMYYLKCLGLFHRKVTPDYGPYATNVPDWVCTRCGTEGWNG